MSFDSSLGGLEQQFLNQTLKESSGPKGMDSLGSADPASEKAFGDLMAGNTQGTKGAEFNVIEQQGPFEMQSTRLTGDPVQKTQESDMLRNKVSEALDSSLQIGRKHEARILELVEEVRGGEMSTAQAMEFQYATTDLYLFTDTVSKGVSKTVQGLQTLARNQ